MNNPKSLSKPFSIFAKGASEEKGELAKITNFVGAIAISDLVKTTLGPKGMDKILLSTGEHSAGEIQVTNDGATILKSIYIDNPAAKVLVDISKSQDDEVGDGTTSVCVLAGEFLREAEKLIEKKIHPQTIIAGWRKALQIAFKALEASAIDNSSNPEKFKEDLLNIARTTLSSKILSSAKDHFANLAVEAVLRLKGSTDLERISIIKKAGASLEESYLDDGFILEKKFGVSQPKRLENAKVLIANTPMDTDKIKIYGATVETSSTSEIAEIEETERQKMYSKCDKIVKHGANLFINRQLIYNLPEQYLSDKGVVTIEHADFTGVERLALVLGGEVVSTFDNPELVKLGTAKLIEEIMIGEDKVIKFSGCGGGAAAAIVLRGANNHILDEAQRSLHDALCVLSQFVVQSKTVLGAGCSEMLMAQAVEDAAKKTEGKEALAMEAYARSLRMIPTILADNAGFDTADLISKLRAAHAKGSTSSGLDMESGNVADISQLKITESFKVKSQVLTSASEAAEMILRVDQIIRAAPRERKQDPRYQK